MAVKNYYIHIPFCKQKCPYCKFALTPVFDDIKKKRYIGHLKKEICEYFQSQILHNASSPKEYGTIFFGGGTPSVLSLEEVGEILACFPNGEKHEISFECNPEDITSKYVLGLLELGINRISLGVQSLNDVTLKVIHRSSCHTIFEALSAITSAIARKNDKSIQGSKIQGIGLLHSASLWSRGQKPCISLNVDFILGLPYSLAGETLKNIQLLHKKYPFITHTSVYMLEEGLYPKDWKQHSMNEREMEREYGAICDYFESAGWSHYEISNWARPGYECQHNIGYWNHTDYRGFGLSATSFVDSVRWENSTSFNGYYEGKQMYKESLTENQLKLENIIHRLRTFSLTRDGFDQEKLKEFEQDGLIIPHENTIFLTQTGIFRENFILSELIGK